MADVFDYRSLPPNVQDVLRKYRIVRPIRQPDKTVTEGWAQADLESPDESGKPLGPGPLLDPVVVQRFLDADKTPDKSWFDWMMYQAAGGAEGKKRSEIIFARSHALFMEERTNGYTDVDTGRRYPGRSRAEVEAEWKKYEARFRLDLAVSDQDLASPPRDGFGYYRHWPGKKRIYERVALAVKEFLKLMPKAKQMNNVMAKEGDKSDMVGLLPKNYSTIDELEHAIVKIKRFHDSKHARDDIRVQTVYDDDFLTILVPLTYAAAVHYGLDNWSWANRNVFNQALSSGNKMNNAWYSATHGHNAHVFVYISFKTPMPPWVAYSNNKFRRHELDHLAMMIPADQIANFNENTVRLYDPENRTNLSLGAIKQSILDEPKREYDPEQEEHPVHQGPSVYKDQSEAEAVVQHLEAGLNALKEWGRTFDPNQIVSDFMPNT